jgi:hypothetical protein
MTLKQVKKMANEKGIKVGNMKKDNIIRAIQRAEGNPECFGNTNAKLCVELSCLWRDDCLK